MNDEIKEILDKLKEEIDLKPLWYSERIKLLDYITNLQQELKYQEEAEIEVMYSRAGVYYGRIKKLFNLSKCRIKPNCPVITSMGYEPLRDKADEVDSMFLLTSPFVQQDFVEALALKGLHQIENLALALTAINYLFKNINEETIKIGLMNVKNPYRFEYFPNKNLIVDVSHNPNGIKALKENLDFYYPKTKKRFVFGCLKNKDYKKMMNIL